MAFATKEWSTIMRTIISGLLAFGMLAAVAGEASARAKQGRDGALEGPGSCGQYMYWQEGKCVDARTKPSDKPWSDEMLAKKWAA